MGTSAAEKARHERILRYWHAVELFTPSAVPKVTKSRNPSPKVVSLDADRPLPWERRESAAKGRVWQHTVYAGVFDIGRYADVLRVIFRESDDHALDEMPPSGRSALLCFTVNQDGCLIKESPVLSSCAWALSRALDPGPQNPRWLDDFENSKTALLKKLLDLGDGKLPIVSAPLPSPGDRADQDRRTRWLGRIAGVAADIVLGVARSEVGVLASGVGTAVGGGVVGTAAAKTVEVLGDRLLGSARDRLASTGTDAQQLGASLEPTGGSADASVTVTADESVGTKVLDLQDLVAITRWLADELGIGELLEPDAIRVKSVAVSERFGDEAGREEMLNSFIADDLLLVSGEAGKGNLSAAMVRYLTAYQGIDVGARIDVRKEPSAVFDSEPFSVSVRHAG
jgi:hypothetical protein